VSPVFAYSTQAFPEISDFTDYIDTSIRGASPPGGSNGIFGDSFMTVFDSYYQRVDDRALSVSSALYTTVDMKLPSDPITRKFRFSFEKSAHLAILSLPPAYNTSTNKAIFKAFIQRYSISISCSCLQSLMYYVIRSLTPRVRRYGTSVVISASLGGLLEQFSSWKTPLVQGGFTKERLARNAEIDFTTTTGLGGHSGTLGTFGFKLICLYHLDWSI
jgi:hypothetical protein